jgi:hypothetical protein
MSKKMVGHFILKLATAVQIIMTSVSTAFLEQIKTIQ